MLRSALLGVQKVVDAISACRFEFVFEFVETLVVDLQVERSIVLSTVERDAHTFFFSDGFDDKEWWRFLAEVLESSLNEEAIAFVATGQAFETLEREGPVEFDRADTV